MQVSSFVSNMLLLLALFMGTNTACSTFNLRACGFQIVKLTGYKYYGTNGLKVNNNNGGNPVIYKVLAYRNAVSMIYYCIAGAERQKWFCGKEGACCKGL